MRLRNLVFHIGISLSQVHKEEHNLIKRRLHNIYSSGLLLGFSWDNKNKKARDTRSKYIFLKWQYLRITVQNYPHCLSRSNTTSSNSLFTSFIMGGAMDEIPHTVNLMYNLMYS